MSLESQFSELIEFAAKEKLEIVASLSEAQTAKEPGRTVFGEMLDRICLGEAQGILAWHPDRLVLTCINR
jgi:DNA invertase Pin-like site-specific DNA recombinase